MKTTRQEAKARKALVTGKGTVQDLQDAADARKAAVNDRIAYLDDLTAGR